MIFICLGFTAENTEGAKEGTVEIIDGTVAIIARIGITLSGIALGFCLGNCWAEYKRGNSKWVKAMEIDQHVVVEIAKTVRDYRDTATSLSMLSTSDDHETYKRSLYFLIQRRHSFRHFVEDMALKIRALGYDHKAFLAATEESSKEIQILTDSLVNSISESANAESIKPLIEGLKANSPFVHNLDQVESRETPPPKAIEDKTQKKDTGPKTP